MGTLHKGWDNQRLPLKPEAVCYYGGMPQAPINIYLYGTRRYNGDRYVLVGVNEAAPVKRKVYKGEKGYGNYFVLNNERVSLMAFQKIS